MPKTVVFPPNYPNFRLGRRVGSPCDVLAGAESETEKAAEGIRISAQPNPSAGPVVFTVDGMNQNSPMVLEIYNPMSERITTLTVSPFQSIVTYEATSLPEGLYFAVLKKANTVVSMCKFLVIR